MNNILQKKALNILKDNKLRLTKQRVSLVENIYYNGDRHITAESLYKQMSKEGIKISLATVYNTLHFLTKVGMLRNITVNSSQKYFDTNVTPHHHFYDESNNSLIDIPKHKINFLKIPSPPKSKKIADVEVIISLKNK